MGHDEELYALFNRDTDYAQGIFAIDRGGKKPRKDIRKWSDVRDYVSYFYDETWQGEYDLPENLQKEDMIAILDTYAKAYEEAPDKNTWFDGVKAICEGLGFCPEVKAYKQDPTGWKGHVGDVSNVVFTNGAIADEDGRVSLYYASSDTRMHVAETTVERLCDYVFHTPADPLRSPDCVRQRCELIRKNLEYGKR